MSPFYRVTQRGLVPHDPRLTVDAQPGRERDPRLTARWRALAKRTIRRSPYCAECGHPGDTANPLQADHITSLEAGGAPFDEANLQVLLVVQSPKKLLTPSHWASRGGTFKGSVFRRTGRDSARKKPIGVPHSEKWWRLARRVGRTYVGPRFEADLWRGMANNNNKEVLSRFYDEINAGNTDVIEDVIAEDMIEQHPLAPSPDREGVRRFFTMVRAGFPDMSFGSSTSSATATSSLAMASSRARTRASSSGSRRPTGGQRALHRRRGLPRRAHGRALGRDRHRRDDGATGRRVGSHRITAAAARSRRAADRSDRELTSPRQGLARVGPAVVEGEAPRSNAVLLAFSDGCRPVRTA